MTGQKAIDVIDRSQSEMQKKGLLQIPTSLRRIRVSNHGLVKARQF
jgi:hypothetical protein